MNEPLCPRGHVKTATRYGSYERWRCLTCAKQSNARRDADSFETRQELRRRADERAAVSCARGER